MKFTLKYIPILSLQLISGIAIAQNSSPYSYFGIGATNNTENVRNISLGSTGIALESEEYLNTRNPASIINEKSVIFDINGLFKYNTITSGKNEDHRLNANFTSFGMGFGISKKFSLGVGLRSTSATDYKIESTIPIEGTDQTYPITYEGNGGVSDFGVSLGYKITDNWSIGAKAKNYFGAVMRKESITLNSTITNTEISKDERYTGFAYGLGTQFNHYFPQSRLRLTLGAIVNFENTLTSRGETIYTEDLDYTNSVTTKFKTKDSKLPLEKGIGMSLLYNDRYRLSFDYSQSDWNKVKSTTTSERYFQQNVYGLGFEVLPNKRITENIFDSFRYRFGLNYDSGYYKINGTPINKFEATAGLGFSLNRTLLINLNYGYGIKGLQNGTAVRENYHTFNIGFNFLELWFLKRQID